MAASNDGKLYSAVSDEALKVDRSANANPSSAVVIPVQDDPRGGATRSGANRKNSVQDNDGPGGGMFGARDGPGEGSRMGSMRDNMAPSRKMSMYSYNSTTSSTNGHGRELYESPYFKTMGVKLNIFSAVNNVILLVILTMFYRDQGLLFNFGPEIFAQGYDAR